MRRMVIASIALLAVLLMVYRYNTLPEDQFLWGLGYREFDKIENLSEVEGCTLEVSGLKYHLTVQEQNELLDMLNTSFSVTNKTYTGFNSECKISLIDANGNSVLSLLADSSYTVYTEKGNRCVYAELSSWISICTDSVKTMYSENTVSLTESLNINETNAKKMSSLLMEFGCHLIEFPITITNDGANIEFADSENNLFYLTFNVEKMELESIVNENGNMVYSSGSRMETDSSVE